MFLRCKRLNDPFSPYVVPHGVSFIFRSVFRSSPAFCAVIRQARLRWRNYPITEKNRQGSRSSSSYVGGACRSTGEDDPNASACKAPVFIYSFAVNYSVVFRCVWSCVDMSRLVLLGVEVKKKKKDWVWGRHVRSVSSVNSTVRVCCWTVLF